MLKAMAASVGIGIGRAVMLSAQVIAGTERPVLRSARELERFENASEEFCAQISRVRDAAAKHFGKSELGIIASQMVVTQDPELREQIAGRLECGVCAEQAVCDVLDDYIKHFLSLEDELMRARAADFKDIKLRMLLILSGAAERELPVLEPDSVLVAEELTPSEAVMLLPYRPAALVTADGHEMSHVTILARTLGIPAVCRAKNIPEHILSGDKLIVNGDTGEVIVRPTAEEIHRYRQRSLQQIQARKQLAAISRREAVTRDGKRILLSLNQKELRQLPELEQTGADGIGLFRADFLYAGERPPGEQQQFLTYRAVTRALDGKPATICTIDIERDKSREAASAATSEKISYCLANSGRLRVQLTALLRASAFGKLRIILPALVSVGELRAVRELLEQCKLELDRRRLDFDPDIRLGVLIETPAAAITASTLAREADFFNLSMALTQHILATDRTGLRGQELYAGFHPAVLQLVYRVIRAAEDAGIPVGACGDISSDPMMLPFLVGCGIHEISVEAARLFSVQEQLGNLNYLYWSERIPAILALDTPEQVVEYIKTNWAERR